MCAVVLMGEQINFRFCISEESRVGSVQPARSNFSCVKTFRKKLLRFFFPPFRRMFPPVCSGLGLVRAAPGRQGRYAHIIDTDNYRTTFPLAYFSRWPRIFWNSAAKGEKRRVTKKKKHGEKREKAENSPDCQLV